MKFKSILALSLIVAVLSSCSEQRMAKKLSGDWWPIHASGSYEDNVFSAKWDGDLDDHGSLVVQYKSKTQEGKIYNKTIYYSALSFTKDARKNDAVRYISLRNLYEISRSGYMKYYIEDGKIYLEKANEEGKGSGEYMEGQDISFPNDYTLKIGNVTYESYAHYNERTHASRTYDDFSFLPDFSPVGLFEAIIPRIEE